MNLPRSISILAILLCLAACCVLYAQRARVHELRAAVQEGSADPAEKMEPQSGIGATSDRSVEAAGNTNPNGRSAESKSVSTELLRLRSQVTLLRMRKSELERLQQDSQRMQPQGAPGSETELPPGFIRKSETRYAGYQTPEATVESLFWALAQQDLTNLLKAFSAEVAQKVQTEALGSKDFFSSAAAIPGYAIQSRSNTPDGMVDLKVTVGPGIPAETLRLMLIDGEWKVISPGF